ncbi:MAG: hypothetical protein STHCBS139747_002832 [Sporothrix thermara]
MDLDAGAGMASFTQRMTPEPGEPPATTETTATPPMTTTTTSRPPRDAHSPSPPSVASSASTDRCVICLDAVSEQCVAQPCGHRHFDFLCLLSWLLSRHPSCPLCKATVETVQYGDGLSKTFPVPSKSEDEGKASAAAASGTGAIGATEPAPAPLSSYSSPSRIVRPRRQRRLHAAPASSLAHEPPAAALERRRRVYRLGLYARHVGANRHSRYYRELTPRLFAQDPDLVSRARAFLRRELQVFWEGADRPVATEAALDGAPRGRRRANNVEFLLEYIVAILQTIDLQDSSGQAEKLLQGFFGGRRDHTRQFLHELRSFLRSPYLTLASWDRHVQYGPPGPLFRDDDDASENNEDGQEVSDVQRGLDVKGHSSQAQVNEASLQYDPS